MIFANSVVEFVQVSLDDAQVGVTLGRIRRLPEVARIKLFRSHQVAALLKLTSLPEEVRRLLESGP